MNKKHFWVVLGSFSHHIRYRRPLLMTNFVYPLIIFATIFIHCPLSYGAAISQLEDILEKIEANVAKTKTIQSRFKQLRFLNIFTKPVSFNGIMVLDRPDKLRWETLSPIPSVMIFNGNNGLRCNSDTKPVHFDLQNDPLMRTVSQQIWTWANSSFRKMGDQYSLNLVAPMTIELTPRNLEIKKSIDSIRIVFQNKTLQPEKIIITETKGDRTELYFSDYILNDQVSPSLFNTCYQE